MAPHAAGGTAAPTRPCWASVDPRFAQGGTIYLKDDGKALFRNVRITKVGNIDGAIQVLGEGSQLVLEHVAFKDILAEGVSGRAGEILPLFNVSFTDVQGTCLTVYGNAISDLNISDSMFWNCGGYSVLAWRYEGTCACA